MPVRPAHPSTQIEVWAATLAARQKSGEAKIDRKGNLLDKESRTVGHGWLLLCAGMEFALPAGD